MLPGVCLFAAQISRIRWDNVAVKLPVDVRQGLWLPLLGTLQLREGSIPWVVLMPEAHELVTFKELKKRKPIGLIRWRHWACPNSWASVAWVPAPWVLVPSSPENDLPGKQAPESTGKVSYFLSYLRQLTSVEASSPWKLTPVDLPKIVLPALGQRFHQARQTRHEWKVGSVETRCAAAGRHQAASPLWGCQSLSWP